MDKLVPNYKNEITLPDGNVDISEYDIKIKMFLGWNISEVLFDLVNKKVLEDAEMYNYTSEEKEELDELLKSNKIKLFYKNAFEIEFENNSKLTYDEAIKKIYAKYVEGEGSD